jgi:hypothetical protein
MHRKTECLDKYTQYIKSGVKPPYTSPHRRFPYPYRRSLRLKYVLVTTVPCSALNTVSPKPKYCSVKDRMVGLEMDSVLGLYRKEGDERSSRI